MSTSSGRCLSRSGSSSTPRRRADTTTTRRSSWPATCEPCSARSRRRDHDRPPDCRHRARRYPPPAAGRWRRPSRPAKASPGSTTTRSAARPPGDAGPCSPRSPMPCSPSSTPPSTPPGPRRPSRRLLAIGLGVALSRRSGRPGYVLARVAAQRGAAVTLVAAHTADLGDPVGFQKSVCACDLRRSAFHAASMITDVSLRLLYLIFNRILSWLVLLGRATSSKGSNSSSCATRSPYSAGPTRGLAWTGPTEPWSQR